MVHIITGCAGFIGSHLCERLLAEGEQLIGVDNLDPFYDVALKRENLKQVEGAARRGSTTGSGENWKFLEGDITDAETYERLRKWIEHSGKPLSVIHLAARAGVRPSIMDPVGYQKTNVEGTQYLLEFAREQGIESFIFASSSSVYGVNPKRPWSEADHDLQPISPYASTKLSGEFLGHVYSKIFGIRFIALRFFTVYGPRQRPDLAIRKFMTRIEREESIPVFGDGSTSRDYTYVEDTVEGIIGAMKFRESPFEIFNLGNDHSVSLNRMIETLEKVIGKSARRNRRANQLGDVPHTLADIGKSREKLNYRPTVAFEEGIRRMWESRKD